MLKRIAIILLAGLLSVTVIACSSKDEDESISSTDASSSNSTNSTVSFYEEDGDLTSSELEEIVSEWMETVSPIIVPSENPSSEENTSSEVGTSSVDSSTSSTSSSESVSSDNTSSSSSENWIGPF